jgi:hypothetical protein
VGLNPTDVTGNEGFSLNVQLVKYAPLKAQLQTPSKKSVSAADQQRAIITASGGISYEVKQFRACGQVNLADSLRDISMDKEEREISLYLFPSRLYHQQESSSTFLSGEKAVVEENSQNPQSKSAASGGQSSGLVGMYSNNLPFHRKSFFECLKFMTQNKT